MKILAAILLLCSLVCAQDRPRFWTAERKVATALFSAEVGFDGAATQFLQRQGYHELDPLSAPFTNRGARGQAAYSVLSVADFILADRLLSKHHPKAARIVRWCMVGGEGAVAVREERIARF